MHSFTEEMKFDRSHNGGCAAPREGLPEGPEEAAEGAGVLEEKASEREANRPEAALRCDREDYQRKKVPNFLPSAIASMNT